MRVFLDGAIMDEADARIAPGDRGFTLGDGLFETLCVRGGRILRLPAHLARLARGAQVLALPLPPLDIAAALAATLAANALADGVLRLTLTRGPGPRGVLPPPAPRPTMLVTAAPLPPPAPPARLVVAQSTRRNERSPLCGVKSLNYLDNILARQEATRAGADDAVLLNTRDAVAETSIANIFAVVDGRVLTPPLRDGALPGVMRAELLARGAQEQTLTAQMLAGAQEIFLSSSLGVRPVREIDGRPLSAFATAELFRARLLPD